LERDGEDHSFYAQFNTLQTLKYVVAANKKGEPVACSAIKEFDRDTMEVKRMFTLPQIRGEGIAGKILSELEKWASELLYKKSVLKNGKRQREAIELYKKNDYNIISNYGQYASIENSVCFEKYLV
jgi:GNAT superfamily N-acetyltransferase